MTWVCTKCGSDDVYQDAYVPINGEWDAGDALLFEHFYCNSCVRECHIIEKENIDEE